MNLQKSNAIASVDTVAEEICHVSDAIWEVPLPLNG